MRGSWVHASSQHRLCNFLGKLFLELLYGFHSNFISSYFFKCLFVKPETLVDTIHRRVQTIQNHKLHLSSWTPLPLGAFFFSDSTQVSASPIACSLRTWLPVLTSFPVNWPDKRMWQRHGRCLWWPSVPYKALLNRRWDVWALEKTQWKVKFEFILHTISTAHQQGALREWLASEWRKMKI